MGYLNLPPPLAVSDCSLGFSELLSISLPPYSPRTTGVACVVKGVGSGRGPDLGGGGLSSLGAA